MYIKNTPFHIAEDGINKIEDYYNAKFMGSWCIKDKFGNWNDEPVDVFFQYEPDETKGETNYFGVFKGYDAEGKMNIYICDATSAFLEPIYGVLADDGEVLISRYRADKKEKNNHMIVGGRDFIQKSEHSKVIEVAVHGDKFLMNEV